MHSNRMPIVRCSDRLMMGRGVCPGGSLPRGLSAQGVCLPRGCLPRGCLPKGVSAWRGCLPGGGVCPGGCTHPPVDRILDKHLWKHYLSATSFANSNYSSLINEFPIFVWIVVLFCHCPWHPGVRETLLLNYVWVIIFLWLIVVI